MFDDSDALDEFIEFDAFLTLCEAFQPCLRCNIGILLPVDSEPNTCVCDVCSKTFRIEEE